LRETAAFFFCIWEIFYLLCLQKALYKMYNVFEECVNVLEKQNKQGKEKENGKKDNAKK